MNVYLISTAWVACCLIAIWQIRKRWPQASGITKIGGAFIMATAIFAIAGAAVQVRQAMRDYQAFEADKPAQIGRTIAALPIGVRVASLDAGRLMRQDDVASRRADFLLLSLATKTGMTREAVADQAAAASDLALKEFGRAIPIAEMLERANRSEAIASGQVSMAAYLATNLVAEQ